MQSAINSISYGSEGVFTCAMDSGLRIYNMDPLHELLRLDTSVVGSVSICEMLNRSNIFAIVSGGKKQKFADNTVLLWDDHTKKFVAEITLSSQVVAVKLRKDRLFAAERQRIHAFSFPEKPGKLFTVITGDNPKGLMEVSPFQTSVKKLLVYPGPFTGSIRIVDIDKMGPNTYDQPVTIPAHKSDIACIAVNASGTLVATGSVRGTLIRVFDVINRISFIELRRGSDAAALYCINFSSNSEFLSASSDKGTVHIFALKKSYLNKRLPISAATKWITSYAESQWAFAKFKVPEECKCICPFGSESFIYAICVDGSFYKYIFTTEGKCHRKSFDNFIDLYDDNYGIF